VQINSKSPCNEMEDSGELLDYTRWFLHRWCSFI